MFEGARLHHYAAVKAKSSKLCVLLSLSCIPSVRAPVLFLLCYAVSIQRVCFVPISVSHRPAGIFARKGGC